MRSAHAAGAVRCSLSDDEHRLQRSPGLPGPPADRDVPGWVNLGPVGYVLPGDDQVVQGIGVQDVGSCNGDTRTCRWRPRRHETRQTCTVVKEGKLVSLRNDLHDEMRARVVRAPLERIRRSQQPAISAVEVQLNVNVAVGLAPQAIDNPGDRDAAVLHVKPERQVHASKRRPRLALAGMEPVQPASCAGEQRVQAAAERKNQHDRGQPQPSAANPALLPERTHPIKLPTLSRPNANCRIRCPAGRTIT